MNFNTKLLFFTLILTFSVSGRSLAPMQIYSLGKDHALKDGKVTVFIHGTTNIAPFIEPVFGGIIDDWTLNTGRVLSQASPTAFPSDTFYIYRWPGAFNIKVRKKAAQSLFEILCDHKGPLTIIGHSHGCSIALYLAELAQLHKAVHFKVDRLILLAPPVQEQTAHLVQSPIFKKVYSFYSSTDLWQTFAPERVIKHTGKRSRAVMMGSKRVFPSWPNLIQVRVLINEKNPGHLDFFYTPFLSKLPSVMNFLDEHAQNNEHVILNIPTNTDRPSFLTREYADILYAPRAKKRSYISLDKKKRKAPQVRRLSKIISKNLH